MSHRMTSAEILEDVHFHLCWDMSIMCIFYGAVCTWTCPRPCISSPLSVLQRHAQALLLETLPSGECGGCIMWQVTFRRMALLLLLQYSQRWRQGFLPLVVLCGYHALAP